MKLSINNLLDWLTRRGYTVAADIHNAQPILTGIRFLSQYSPKTRPMNVAYVGPAWRYIESAKGTILCSKNDIVYIDNSDTDLIFNECIQAFDYYNQWEIDLLDATVSDARLDRFIELGHRVFQSPMFISGANGQTYAITQQYPADIHPIWKNRLENGNQPYSIIGAHHDDPYFQKMYSSTYPQIADSPIWGKKILFSNLRSKGDRIGSVIIYEYDHEFHGGDVHLLDVYAKIVAKALLLHPTTYFSLSELEKSVLDILSTGETNADQLVSKMRSFGWKRHDRYLVLCAVPPSGIDSVITGRIRDMIKNRFPGLCTVLYNGRLFAVVNGNLLKRPDQLLDDLKQMTDDRIRIGVSMEFFDFNLLYYHSKQAIAAVENILNTDQTVCRFQEIYLQSCRKKISDDFPALQSFIHPDIQLLMKTDLETNGEYVKTLYYYIICGCNYREAARALHVHRNTLVYRMEKIRPMLTLDLEDLYQRQVLLVSLFFLMTFSS